MRGDYLDAELIVPISYFLCRCFKYGFCNAVAMVEQLLEKSDQKMFPAVQNPEHCIHTLLPPSTDSDRSPRPSGHNYQPSVVTRKLCHQSFIPHSFFKYVHDCPSFRRCLCILCSEVFAFVFLLFCSCADLYSLLLCRCVHVCCAFTINE